MCLVNGLLDDGRVRQVVGAVVESRRRGYMALLSQFQRLVRLKREQHTVKVASAALLEPDLQLRVTVDLERLYGPGLSVRFTENPDLIAGMRVVVGSDVYDGSVRHRLALLNKSFSAPGQ